MAATVLTIVQTQRTTPPEQQAAGQATTVEGMTLANDGRTFLEVKAEGGACEMKFVIQGNTDGQSFASLVLNVAEGKTKYIGPFPPAIYNNTSGIVEITCVDTKGKVRAIALGS